MHPTTKLNLTLLGLLILAGLAVWVNLPQHPSLNLGAIQRDLNLKLGLDLQGGAHLVYRADVGAVDTAEVDNALAGVRDVIERRINAFGVSEPVVQTNQVGDEHRVIIELAGIFDVNEAIDQIGATPQLDFRRETELSDDVIQQLNIDDTTDLAGLAGPVFEVTQLSGKQLDRAVVSFDQVSGAAQVNLEFDSEGTDLFAELTEANVGKRIGIFLDGVAINAPVVQQPITNGQAVISGGFTVEEARTLAQRLNAGALPVPIELIGQQTIGPTLGQRSVQQSITAGLFGLLAVIIWMLIFYRLPGLVASIALLFYVAVFLALIKLIPITLTLAGIAGFILSIGMAVDANVLIFERFREGLRAGKNVPYALNQGFRDAWSAIKAGNISSIITALILYGFGTSIIRGFALTFGLGIILSMFTAIVVTRTLLTLVLRYQKLHTPFLLSVKKPSSS